MDLNNMKGEVTMTTTVQKWGNSLAVRIPQEYANKFGIKQGSEIKFSQNEKGIVLEPVEGEETLEQLLAQITDENRHEEYFGKPMGRELL